MDQNELMRLPAGVDRVEVHELSNRYAHAIDFMTNHLVELDGPVVRTRRYMHVLNLGMGGIAGDHDDQQRSQAAWDPGARGAAGGRTRV